MTHAKLKVETVPLDRMKPHPRNPRSHPEPGSTAWETMKQSTLARCIDRKEFRAAYHWFWYRENQTAQIEKQLRRYHGKRSHICRMRRRHYRDNRQECLDKLHAYRWANIERVRAYDRARNKGNPKVKLKGRRWYLRNKELTKRRSIEWIKANPHKHRAFVRMRRARLAAVSIADCTSKIVELQRGPRPCVYCGVILSSKMITIDHIIPIARGGKHEPENLAVACKPCNSSKGKKLLQEWER